MAEPLGTGFLRQNNSVPRPLRASEVAYFCTVLTAAVTLVTLTLCHRLEPSAPRNLSPRNVIPNSTAKPKNSEDIQPGSRSNAKPPTIAAAVAKSYQRIL